MSEEFDEIEFLRKAVKTRSDDGVEKFRELIISELENAGIEPGVDSNGSLIATVGEGQPHLVLNSHMDTVKPHVEFDETDSLIRGRGACDAKASVAVFLKTLIDTEPVEGRLSVALTPDEETDSRAVSRLDIDPDAVVVGELTDCDICNCSRGRFEVEINVKGETAHAANPESGINAVKTAARIITLLEDFDSGQEDQKLGEPTLTPTIVEGGESSNVIPENCRIRVDRRCVPGEGLEEFIERLKWFIENLDTEAEIEISRGANNSPFLGGFRTPEDEKLIQTLKESADTEIRPFEAVCEASYFAPEIPTAVFGPGKLRDQEGGVAHSDREYVSKKKVKEATEILKTTVNHYLQE